MTKSFITLLFSLLAMVLCFAQEQINVVSFDRLTNDMDARINEPKIDQNGEKCAIIKVVTGDDGFVWEGGTLGIVDAVKKTGEYWLYVPRGAKRLTIKHDQLGVLRNYIYPIAIQEAEVYEMKISTAKVITILDGPEINTGFVVINSDPEGADVYIDEMYMGQTPLQKELRVGKHNYRIEKHLYHTDAGQITILLNVGTQRINRELKPKFGNVRINSLPEGGATVYVDDVKTDLKTPCTVKQLAAGRHIIHLRHEWYEPQKAEVFIEEGITNDLDVTMEPAFGTIHVSTNPLADIFVDNIKVGSGNYTGKLRPGFYQVEARLNQYRTENEKLEIKNQEEKQFNFTLIPIKGALKVKTTPIDVDIYLEGEYKGKSPVIIPDLLVGDYNVELKKEGFAGHAQIISIRENQITDLISTLVTENAKTSALPVVSQPAIETAAPPVHFATNNALATQVQTPGYIPEKARTDEEAITIAERIRQLGVDRAAGSPALIQQAHKNANDYIDDYLSALEEGTESSPKTIPQFQGGDIVTFKTYVENNLLYPEVAVSQRIEGRVIVKFTVNRLGYVSNVAISRGSNEIINEEAIRVIASSPRWEPGRKRDNPVNVSYTIPVYFNLD